MEVIPDTYMSSIAVPLFLLDRVSKYRTVQFNTGHLATLGMTSMRMSVVVRRYKELCFCHVKFQSADGHPG
ncbi:hypothetical protein FKM82_009475 [Ascaphus truei]